MGSINLGWEPDAAAALVGKRVLVGIELVDNTGAMVRQIRYWGWIASADEAAGIDVRLDEGGSFQLPSNLSNFAWVPADEYHEDLRSGCAEHPEVRATWRIITP